ncbi:hypothetical protein Ais01nite_29510 [Asanoa ishikariensis]|uniref:DUF11 domain-containing protein n=1 Tax=Asanoa ishikariensis TaxID=137265 RepID=A0A1H3QMT7_9ACTN|nr:hypothetical protein [Asanoa ishikariensis]GIF64916.1 hypothetical protein Ais01nite_29510 [Asanoa ishikariensis]SDZ14039.1 hypothetical protein SAMN05421684_2971 [Asanoa ishikariensis]
MASSQRAYALLRASVAGLIAAGMMALIVTVPSMGAGAASPVGVTAALDPGDDTGGNPGDPETSATEPDSPPTNPVPSDDPTSPEPTSSPTASEQPTEQPSTDPTTRRPTTRPSAREDHPTGAPPEQPGPVLPGQPQLGATVWTGDVSLGWSYWSRSSSPATLRVVVTNTGSIVERMTMRYTLPAGVTDAGTAGCALSGGRSYVCGSWVAGPGHRFETSIRVRVAGNAWQQMPLGGSVDVTAAAVSRPDLGSIVDNQGFAVLFPPGPPVAGIGLAAGEVNFDSPTGPANLQVKLTNTGDDASTGAVEVLLPEGVTVDGQPAGCASNGERFRCDVGRLRADETVTTTVPLRATAEAQRLAPLSGAVFGMLTSGGRTKQVQMSFRITAAAATATPAASPGGAAGPTASQGVIGGFAKVSESTDGLTGVQKTALALVIVSVLLVVLAITLATTSLRRRIEDDTTAAFDAATRD